jgi:O-antigen ligase
MNTIFQYGSTSSQFWIWMVSLSFSQAVFNRNLKPIARVGLFVFVGVIFLSASTLTGWKSGWLPAVLSAAVILALYSRRFAVLMAIGAIAAGPVVFADLIASDQYSYTTRVGAWLTIAEIVKANPILGLGPANYYWYTPYFQILNYVAVQFSSHNQYVDIIAQTGLLGLAVFLWFALEVGRLGLRLRNHVPVGFAQAYVYGALGGLVGTLAAGMLGDWIVPFVYNVGLVGFRASVYGWLFLGGLVALEQIYQYSRQAPQNPPV